jgi:hypothetical protein
MHKLIGFYNRDEKCLQRGTDWGFNWSSLRLVGKGLDISKPSFIFKGFKSNVILKRRYLCETIHAHKLQLPLQYVLTGRTQTKLHQ